ncbi:hypothetical protein BDQ12DRAFT_692135 [Crucibulum laeve]|uniref:Mid2 domain-containing protein n=1 Tax=Crucibulum laeve TaxID=68775 RepID=A0A5C3LKA1_9AGAR|nr:hypothetical protein BDQ12DRAFT_692135 [Crucibulum laeve]
MRPENDRINASNIGLLQLFSPRRACYRQHSDNTARCATEVLRRTEWNSRVTLGMNSKFLVVVCLAFFATFEIVAAEQHTISFDNRCGNGTPHLLQNGNTVSTSGSFTSPGSFSSGTAFLQTGDCGANGAGCTVVEMSLSNPSSFVDITLVPSFSFSVPTAFSFSGGCDGQGATCASADCTSAFHSPTDDQALVSCQSDNVNLQITFCPSGSSSSGGSNGSLSQGSPVTSSVVASPSSSTTSSASSSSPPASSSVVSSSSSSSAPSVSFSGTSRIGSSSSSSEISNLSSSGQAAPSTASSSSFPSETGIGEVPGSRRSSSLGVGPIVGIVIGVLVLLLILAFCLFLLRRHRKRTRPSHARWPTENSYYHDTATTPVSSALTPFQDIFASGPVSSSAQEMKARHTQQDNLERQVDAIHQRYPLLQSEVRQKERIPIPHPAATNTVTSPIETATGSSHDSDAAAAAAPVNDADPRQLMEVREEVRRMLEQMESLRAQQLAEWRMGSGDEPPPEYTSNAGTSL